MLFHQWAGNLDNGCRSIMSDQNKEKQQEEDDIVGYVQMMMYVSIMY